MPRTLFVSYSHKDEKLKNYVTGHLGVAGKQGLLRIWDDRQIRGGEDWRKKIDTALAEADVAILLVSGDFLTSDFILNEEVPAILKRRDQDGLIVYPIIIRACDWEAVDWLKVMNLRPTDGMPLDLYSEKKCDQVMAGICKEIRELIGDIAETATPDVPASSTIDGEMVRLVQQTDALTIELGTTRAALNSMFEILAEKNVPVEQLETKLREIAERFVEQTKRSQALSKSNDDPAITSLLEQVTEALEEGEYDQAADLLAEARSITRQAREAQQQALDRSMRDEASILGEQGELENARFNYKKAAQYYDEAADMAPPSDNEMRLSYLHKGAGALYARGNEFGDNAAADEAIKRLQDLSEQYHHEGRLLDWAKAQNRLGNALYMLGQRGGAERLGEAVDAYNNALKQITREKMPRDWAVIQMNLGNVLSTLGQWKTGRKNLYLAITAYHAALEEWKQKDKPLLWAKAQYNLGIALRELGQREGSSEKLKQSIAAHHAALKERTRTKVPLDWARTQNSLGGTLKVLGEKENNIKMLEQAVDAYKAALEERPRERVPLDWAETQYNFAIALKTIGERERGTARLEQAIEAYQASLEVRTQEATPFDWARTKWNLGNVLTTLGEREDNTARLEHAIDTCKAAFQVLGKGKERPLDWAIAQLEFSNALRVLGLRTKNSKMLEQAVDASRAALGELARDRVPFDWAWAQSNLGNALLALGKQEDGTEKLEQAINAYQAALKEKEKSHEPGQLAYAQQSLGLAYLALAKKQKSEEVLNLGIKSIKSALKIFEKDNKESEATLKAIGYMECANKLKKEIIIN